MVPGPSLDNARHLAAKRFGRRRVPKIAEGLTIFTYSELQKGRWIPGDGPVLQDLPPDMREDSLTDFGGGCHA